VAPRKRGIFLEPACAQLIFVSIIQYNGFLPRLAFAHNVFPFFYKRMYLSRCGSAICLRPFNFETGYCANIELASDLLIFVSNISGKLFSGFCLVRPVL